jgi:hypothetical protein
MDEVLTIDEINQRFKDEWVLVDNPQTDEQLRVQSGVVRFHSKDRDEVYAKAAQLSSRKAFVFTGRIPDDMVIVL